MWRHLLILLGVLAVGGTAHAASCTEPGSIIRVRNSVKGNNEYVVFTLRKSPDMSKFGVQAVLPPFSEDGSGKEIPVAGSSYTEVKFRDVFWMCSIAERLNLPQIGVMDVVRTGQFEGIVTYVIGRGRSAHFVAVYSYDARPGYYNVVVKYRR
jgi:hypothetical protein